MLDEMGEASSSETEMFILLCLYIKACKRKVENMCINSAFIGTVNFVSKPTGW